MPGSPHRKAPNAFLEIVAQLIEAVPPTAWEQHRNFPDRLRTSERAVLFDALLFTQGAHGALGFLWLKFPPHPELYVFPFRLARYSEDGDLISLPPWSLREAANDREFFEAWRRAQMQRNPLLTDSGAEFHARACGGEPSLVTLDLWSRSTDTFVRVDSQEAYKIFRLVDPDAPMSREVEVLEYLTNQDGFLQFPKLIQVFEFRSGYFPRAHAAMSMKYLQNQGTLWIRLVPLLRAARFPKRGQELRAKQAAQVIRQQMENLGRLVAEFHRAMMRAKGHRTLAPEINTESSRLAYLAVMEQKTNERLAEVLQAAQESGDCPELVSGLGGLTQQMFARFKTLADFGVRIRIHGNLHLGQILISNDVPLLVDFESDFLDESFYLDLKQPALKDIAATLVSLRLAWLRAEGSQQDELLFPSLHIEEVKNHQGSLGTPTISELAELETIFLRFYTNLVFEDANTSELLPPNEDDSDLTLDLFLLLRMFKEVVRDARTRNPRVRTSLRLLSEFAASSELRTLLEAPLVE